MNKSNYTAHLECINSVTLPEDVSAPSALAFLAGGEGILLGTGSQHLVFMPDKGSIQYIGVPFCPRAISPSPNGNIIVVCGEGPLVLVLRNDFSTIFSINVPDRFLNTIAWVDHHKCFAVAGETGRVHIISLDKEIVVDYFDLSGPILCLAEEDNGGLLVSTYSGHIFRLRDGAAHVIFTADGPLWSVLSRAEGWISGSLNGIIYREDARQPVRVGSGTIACLKAAAHNTVVALCHDDRIRLLSREMLPVDEYPAYPGWASTLAVNPNGRRCAWVDPLADRISRAFLANGIKSLSKQDQAVEKAARPQALKANRHSAKILSPDGQRSFANLGAVSQRIFEIETDIVAAALDGDELTGWAIAGLVFDLCAVIETGVPTIIPHSEEQLYHISCVPIKNAHLAQRRFVTIALHSGIFTHIRVTKAAAMLTTATGSILTVAWNTKGLIIDWIGDAPGKLEAEFSTRAIAFMKQYPARFDHSPCPGTLEIVREIVRPRAVGLLEAALLSSQKIDASFALSMVSPESIPLALIISEDREHETGGRVKSFIERLGYRADQPHKFAVGVLDAFKTVTLFIPIFGTHSKGWEERAIGQHINDLTQSHRSGQRQRWLPIFTTPDANTNTDLSSHLLSYDSLILSSIKSDRELLEILNAAILTDRARY